MIRLNFGISAIQLSNLGCKNLAIQTKDSSPGRLTAYFDFEEILSLDSHDCDSIWEEFSSGDFQDKLSFSGWVGFLDMNFWLSILAYNLMLKRTCQFLMFGLDDLKALSLSKLIKP